MRNLFALRLISGPLSVLGLLAGCGGGGSDGVNGQPLAPAVAVNVATAWHNYLTLNNTYVTKGTAPASAGSVPFTLTFKFVPGGSATLPLSGAAGSTNLNTQIVDTGDGDPLTVTRQIFFAADALLGVQNSDGTCSVATPTQTALPVSATIGAAGPLAITQDFDTCTPPPPTSTILTTALTYSVQDDAGVTFFCVDETQTSAGAFYDRGTTCIEVTADGQLGGRAMITLYITPSDFIVSRNY